MKKTVTKSVLIFIIGFFGLFLFRLVYGFISYPSNNTSETALLNQFIDSGNSFSNNFNTRNYASKKIIRQNASSVKAPMSVDQKYEKVASVSSKTTEFEKAENKTRQLIKSFNALIQFLFKLN